MSGQFLINRLHDNDRYVHIHAKEIILTTDRITIKPLTNGDEFGREDSHEIAGGFGKALEALQSGRRVTRRGWNGKGMWIALQKPDAYSKMTAPYIYMKTADGSLVPWLASQTDLLADDWEVI